MAIIGFCMTAVARTGEGRVIGAVLDAAGAPVAGANVVVRPVNGKMPEQKTTTISNGSFHLLILDASAAYKIWIEKDGYLPLDADLQPKVNDTIRVSYTLKPVPTLDEDLASAETEPLAKQVRLNLRFARAGYKPSEDPPLHFRKYVWRYPEMLVVLNMTDFPAGTLTGVKPEATADQLVEIAENSFVSQGWKKISESPVATGTEKGKEFAFKSGEQTLYARIFINGETEYDLIAQPTGADNEKLVHRILNTFQFSKR